MTTLYFIAGDSLFKVTDDNGKYDLAETKTPFPFLCLATDQTDANRMYGGTFDNGLWISKNAGENWYQAGYGITSSRIPSVATSQTEIINGHSVVWAGTEPSRLFRSEDGGDSWKDCPRLGELPSRDTWSFPPRPYTHHVRFIQPDIHLDNRIFTGIELGGVMKSEDKGAHWEDRKKDSQFDCHTLTMHPDEPGRVYEAAGGGYGETLDGGSSWQTINDGLDPYTYLVNIAVDTGDSNIMIAAASKGAHSAYNPDSAHTVLVRRAHDNPWEIIDTGLPSPDGMSISSLVAVPGIPGKFYAVNNLGCFQSVDSGITWDLLPLNWPKHLKEKRIQALNIIP